MIGKGISTIGSQGILVGNRNKRRRKLKIIKKIIKERYRRAEVELETVVMVRVCQSVNNTVMMCLFNLLV